MLRRDAEALFSGGTAAVALLDEVGLLQNLAGVPEELLTLRGGFDSAAGAGENRDAVLALHLADCRGEGWLGEKEPVRGLGDVAGLRGGHDVLQLPKRHGLQGLRGDGFRSHGRASCASIDFFLIIP